VRHLVSEGQGGDKNWCKTGGHSEVEERKGAEARPKDYTTKKVKVDMRATGRWWGRESKCVKQGKS